MKKILYLTMATLATAIALTACGGGDDDDNVVAGPATSVPDSAGISGAALVAFILSLDPNDETSEPLAIADGFAVPDDETDNVLPI